MATGDKESTEVIKRFQDLKEKKTRVQDSEKLNAIFDLLHEYLPSIVATSSTLTALNEEITELKRDFTAVTSDVSDMREEFDQVKGCVREVKEELIQLKRENDLLNTKLIQCEIDRSQNSILIRNLVPKDPNGDLLRNEGEETKASLKANFEGILQTMKIDVRIQDIFRLKSNAKETKQQTRRSLFNPVKVVFAGRFEKNIFFANLSKLKNTVYSNLNVANDVPKSLIKEFNEMDKLGFDLRKKDKEIKCKVVLVEKKYRLMTKKGSQNWVFYNQNDLPPSSHWETRETTERTPALD